MRHGDVKVKMMEKISNR